MRILSYNIHKGIGGRDRRYRLERIIEVIEEQNPDIICLQEVDRNVKRSKFDRQPRLLANYFKSKGKLFQLNVRLKRGGYGNLILSRWKIKTHHHISLQQSNKKKRGAQLAVIETPEGLLHLVNYHLGLAERERRWQVEHLLTHHLFKESEELPTLIIGDTNDWRNTLHKTIFKLHNFEKGTHPASRFRTFPAWLPVGSLDKAFHRGDITIKHAHPIRNKLTRIASDHLPLVVDFHLK